MVMFSNTFHSLMEVADLNVGGLPFFIVPSEPNTVLLVNPDAMEAFVLPAEGFQIISGPL